MLICRLCVKEVTIRGGGLKHVACAEDEDFIQALDKMMLENLQVGKTTNTMNSVVFTVIC